MMVQPMMGKPSNSKDEAMAQPAVKSRTTKTRRN
jgi:hypothetical protein